MNVTAIVRLYPPRDGAGAEWYLHELLLAFRAAGDHVSVHFTADHPGTDEFESVSFAGLDSPDVIITQLDGTPHAKRLARQHGVPWIHVAHHQRQLRQQPTLQVANSLHVAAAAERYGGAVVCRPHVPQHRYQGARGDAVTLVNRSALKGARVFYQLAEAYPDQRFIAVTGAWDVQLPAPKLSNLEVWPNGPINKVYDETRLLYQASQSESWGRCAIEAGWRGIPSIVTDCPGFHESIGDAAAYTVYDDLACTRNVLDCLNDPREYATYSRIAVERAEALEEVTRSDQQRLVRAVHQLA